MAQKKPKGRVRQTKTDWQKVFDNHPEYVQTVPWHPRLPEVIHIAIALIDHNYRKVSGDFKKIADYVNEKHKPPRRFHFNLTHTITLMKTDPSIKDEINKTCFKKAFDLIFDVYVDESQNEEVDLNYLLKAYGRLLDGRSDTSILCKYMMMQYDSIGKRDTLKMFNFFTQKEILTEFNVSRVYSTFPITIAQSPNLNLDFTDEIWQFNYTETPFITPRDKSQMSEEHFAEMEIDRFADEVRDLLSDFKRIELVQIFPKVIAEVIAGFVARLANLSLDVVELIKLHKGEIAELVCRSLLETFIVACWLDFKQDAALIQRFRNYSLGKDRFFADKFSELAKGTKMENQAREMKAKVFKKMGPSHITTPSERGDAFDLRIDQMAEEVWGKDNPYYFIYKRLSGVIHGHWDVISKYHLHESRNPMQAGLYHYNNYPKKYSDLVPAFICLGYATRYIVVTLTTILSSVDDTEIKEMRVKAADLDKKLYDQYMRYYGKYINSTVIFNESDS